MDPNNWDLEAVVRGCRFTGPTTAATVDPFSFLPPPLLLEEDLVHGEEVLLMGVPSMQTSLYELEELCKPFIHETIQQPPPQLQQQQHVRLLSSSATTAAASLILPQSQQPRQPHRPQSQTPRSKRRKNQQKRVVCQVPADGVSPDMWAWRKYGQKPIKGSPYPRGYYRCSSSKGCPARKQVERSRTDPGMLVITYTAEHNHPLPTHRSSLAGSTRHKLPAQPPVASHPVPGGGGDGERPVPHSNPSSTPLSPSAASGLSPTTPLTNSMEDELLRKRPRLRKGETEEEDEDDEEEEEEEEEDPLTVGDMEMICEGEMLFTEYLEGLDALTTDAATPPPAAALPIAPAFAEHFLPAPWLTNNNAAAAAGSS